jgi:hypothetical protein
MARNQLEQEVEWAIKVIKVDAKASADFYIFGACNRG